MKLYYTPQACSLSPHIVLRESGLKFDLEKVDLQTKKTSSGEDYLTINPKGYVPALKLDDNKILTEGPAIIQYIADLKPEANLAPAQNSFDRYRLQEWLNFISTEIHKVLGAFFNPKLPEETKNQLMKKFNVRMDYLDKQLFIHPYILGESFSVADAYLFTVLRWTSFFNINLQSWPALSKYMARIEERPAVHEALTLEKA